jgi:hypothetical protein
VFGQRVGGALPPDDTALFSKLAQITESRVDLPGQARPQPGINSSGINFPTPPKTP